MIQNEQIIQKNFPKQKFRKITYLADHFCVLLVLGCNYDTHEEFEKIVYNDGLNVTSNAPQSASHYGLQCVAGIGQQAKRWAKLLAEVEVKVEYINNHWSTTISNNQ